MKRVLHNSILLYLLNPLISFLTVVFNPGIHSKDYVVVFLLFGAFYGFTLSPDYLLSSDAHQHKVLFEQSHDYGNIVKYIEYQIYADGDIFIPFIRYTTRIFTSNSSFYFAILGALLMYFFAKNIKFLIDQILRHSLKLSTITIFLLLAFSAIYSLVTLNAVRFPLATHIFFYGVIVHFNRNEKVLGIGLLILSGLTHLGLWLPIGIYLLGVSFFRERLLSFALITMVFSWSFSILGNIDFNSSFFDSLLKDSGYEALDKRRNYLSEDYLNLSKKGAEAKNWYVEFRFKYLLFLASVTVIWLHRKFRNSLVLPDLVNFIVLGALLLSVGLFFEDIIHSFRRYYLVGLMSLLAGIALLAGKGLRIPFWLKLNFYISISLLIIVELRIYFYFVTIDTLFSNPILSLFYKTNIVLNFLLE